jgi:hypothetical protein
MLLKGWENYLDLFALKLDLSQNCGLFYKGRRYE